MQAKQFNVLMRELLSPILTPYGFSADNSRRCTYWRRCSDEVFHIILPDRLNRLPRFDVKVFMTSPVIDPSFEATFPDDLGIPTDLYSYLSESAGVGPDQQKFFCKYPDHVRREVNGRLGALLVDTAVPYLSGYASVESMIEAIRAPLMKAFALSHVGRQSEAAGILESKLDWLRRLDASDKKVASIRRRVQDILPEAFN